MQLAQAVELYLREKKGEDRAEYADIEVGMTAFKDYLTDWTPIKVDKVTRLSMVHFQEFFGWWYLRKCHPNSTTARHLLLTMEDFCKFVLRRYDVNLLQIYRPVLEELKDDLPRVVALHVAISPIKSQEYLRYMVASYGDEGAREMGALEEYEDMTEGYMEVEYLGEGTEIFLRSVAEGHEYGPIKVTLDAAKLAREGDIIYLELGEKDGKWEIIDSGYAYPALAKHFIS